MPFDCAVSCGGTWCSRCLCAENIPRGRIPLSSRLIQPKLERQLEAYRLGGIDEAASFVTSITGQDASRWRFLCNTHTNMGFMNEVAWSV